MCLLGDILLGDGMAQTYRICGVDDSRMIMDYGSRLLGRTGVLFLSRDFARYRVVRGVAASID